MSTARFVSNLTLVTRSPEALVSFYSDLFDLDFHRDEYGYPEPFRFTSLGGVQFSIHPAANFPGLSAEPGGVRFAFEVEHLEAVVERARQLGAAVERPAQSRGPGILTALVRDPEGHEITLTERPGEWFTAVEASVRRWRRQVEEETGGRGLLAVGKRLGDAIAQRRSRFKRWLELEVAAPLAYRFDRTGLERPDLSGFSHLVATREGLFAIHREGFARILRGQFFGLTVRQGLIYVFEANGPLVAKKERGRILCLELAGQRIRRVRVVARGLDNGCHQIDFVGSRLVVTDTYNQALILLEEGVGGELEIRETLHPLGEAAMDAWDDGYAHINSVTAHRGETYLLKHNGGFKTGRSSEMVRCDADWNVVETRKLPAAMGHNLVFLEDGRLLSCDSRGGVVVDVDGVVVNVGQGFTRGLSVGTEEVVVGESGVADRRTRQLFSSGKVVFFDRAFNRLAVLDLPAAPTEIRRIDGQDLSLANYDGLSSAPHGTRAAGDHRKSP